MTSNFNSELLLAGRQVKIKDKNNVVYIMNLPLLKDYLDDINDGFNDFVGFCSCSLEKVNIAAKVNFKSKLSLFKYYKKNNAPVVDVLLRYFDKYMVEFHYVDDSLYWGKRIINKEIFETFCLYISISVGIKSIKELQYIITEDMDEFEKKRIEMERKVAKTKAKNKEGKNVSLDIIMTAVCREFGINFQQMLNMTLYGIYFLYSKMGNIMSYEIGNIAAGNGLLKKGSKHNYWAT